MKSKKKPVAGAPNDGKNLIDDRAAAQYHRMVEKPIPGTVLKLAIPTITSMLVTAAYSTADTYYVSQLGTSASAAIGIVFPMMMIIMTIGLTMGMGAGSTISRLLGQRAPERASGILSTAFFMALFAGGILGAVGLAFPGPLMRLLGATDTILPFAEAYARYIFLAAPIMAGSFVLNVSLRAEGNAVLSLIGIGIGTLINIGLDPLFIFELGLGTAGAAIATVISQCIGLSILGSHYFFRRAVLRLSFKKILPEWKVIREILRIGSPTFGRQSMASVGMVVLNTTAAAYGDGAIAAMTITTRVAMLVYSTIIGFGQGFQPVVGYNFGAGRHDRVKQAYWFSTIAGTVYMTIAACLVFIFAPSIIAWFRADDAEVISLGTRALRFHASVWPFQALVIVTNMLYQASGRALPALVMAMSRQGLFLIPSILALNATLQLQGIIMAQPLADLLAFGLAIIFSVRYLKNGPHRLGSFDRDKGTRGKADAISSVES